MEIRGDVLLQDLERNTWEELEDMEVFTQETVMPLVSRPFGRELKGETGGELWRESRKAVRDRNGVTQGGFLEWTLRHGYGGLFMERVNSRVWGLRGDRIEWRSGV